MMRASSTMTFTSPSFEPGELIPQKFTCDGDDVSPELSWGATPEGTDSFVLIVDDPDAPGKVFTHWVLFNLPAQVTGLEEGISAVELLKKGASQGKNDFGLLGYGGPCPPPGKPHRYRFHLYALNTMLDMPSGVSKSAVLSAIKGKILGEAEITGLYGRT